MYIIPFDVYTKCTYSVTHILLFMWYLVGITKQKYDKALTLLSVLREVGDVATSAHPTAMKVTVAHNSFISSIQ